MDSLEGKDLDFAWHTALSLTVTLYFSLCPQNTQWSVDRNLDLLSPAL